MKHRSKTMNPLLQYRNKHYKNLVSPEGYIPYPKGTVLPFNTKDATSNLLRICNLLEENRLEYRVVLGTLLGIHRDNALIPYDHDTDLAIHYRDAQKLVDILPTLENSGATLVLIDSGLLRIALGGTLVDIFLYHPEGDHLVHRDEPPRNYKTTMLLSDFDEYSLVTLNGYKLKAPKDVEGYLATTYGANWRVPIDAKFEACRTQTTVITYGSFDLLHEGHRSLLSKASKLGYSVVVGLSTDAFGLIKGKTHVDSYATRFTKLNNLPYVSLVIPEDNWEQKQQDIKTYGVDTLVLGGDQDYDTTTLDCKVVTIDRLPNISTTILKKKRRRRYGRKRYTDH